MWKWIRRGRPWDKARYMVCGAVVGSLLTYDISLWVTNAFLVDLAIPAGMIGGGFLGYRYEEYKAARVSPVWFSARDIRLEVAEVEHDVGRGDSQI